MDRESIAIFSGTFTAHGRSEGLQGGRPEWSRVGYDGKAGAQ